MMLLPPVEHAIRSAAEAARTITITVATESGRLRVLVSDSESGLAARDESHDVADICARLVALYDTSASLLLRHRVPGGSEAVLDIPYEIPKASECALA